MRPPDLPSMTDVPHGIRARYVAGCRCEECRQANRVYAAVREAAKRRGEWNGLVPAGRARRHLQRLHRAGVGRRTVADISGVATSTIADVRSGKKTHLRRRSEAAILAVTTDAGVNDATLLPAGDVLRRLENLRLEEGWSGRELTRRLGYRGNALQFNPATMTAKNVARVERFIRARLAEREARRVEPPAPARTSADLPFFLRPWGEPAERRAAR